MTGLETAAPYAALFLSAFLAATIFPAQSELVLSGLLVLGGQPWWALVLVAMAGNTLGSLTNWLIGRFVHRLRDKRWFPVTRQNLEKAEGWYRRYGRWSLLLSWAPIVGDPLTLAAGILREPLWSFLILVGCAKLARYLVVAGISLQWG